MQALTFLQNDVHAVVDHDSAEETATFRALHSHLFDPTSSSFSAASKLAPDGDVEMDSFVDVGIGPSEPWLSSSGRTSMPSIPELQRDDEGEAYGELKPERFRQRTQVFESLLELINTDAKQPLTDLVDLVDGPDRANTIMELGNWN